MWQGLMVASDLREGSVFHNFSQIQIKSEYNRPKVGEQNCKEKQLNLQYYIYKL